MMCTYLTEEELKRFTRVGDKDVNKLLQKVIENFDGKFLLEEKVLKRRRSFFYSWLNPEPDETTIYILYFHLGGREVQVMNFASNDKSTSIHTKVSKATIENYFMGMLNGMEFQKCKETEKQSA